jgi:hypothetical protein
MKRMQKKTCGGGTKNRAKIETTGQKINPT